MGTVLTGTAVFEIVAWTDADEATRRRVLTRNGSRDRLTGASTLATSIQELLEDVRARGDAALVDALSRFDKVDCDMDQLRVSDEEFAAARAILPGPVHEAIQLAIERSTTFNREIVERASWSVESGTATLGEIARPIESTGLFVPSGKGSFPSVLVQIGTPAVVAGVPRVVVVVPPDPTRSGRVDPATLVAADELGLRDVFRLNGPSGIGAMALGTERVPRVGTIVGPGSPAVTVAQQLCQGYGCQVVSGLGPTDSCIIADTSADPAVLAADLINEAEHGPDSSAVLVSTDATQLRAVAGHLTQQLADWTSLAEATRPPRWPTVAWCSLRTGRRHWRSPTRTPPSTCSWLSRTQSHGSPTSGSPAPSCSANGPASQQATTSSGPPQLYPPPASPPRSAGSPPTPT